jgi:FXSXX-COOH protein
LTRVLVSEVKVRCVMSDDIADGALLDVSKLSLSELLDELDESSLARAMHRIEVSSGEGVKRYGFSNSI